MCHAVQDALEKWEEKRAAATESCATNRKRPEKVDLSTYKREEEYADFFDEGTVVPISEFLEGLDLDFSLLSKLNTEAKQRRFVEEDRARVSKYS